MKKIREIIIYINKKGLMPSLVRLIKRYFRISAFVLVEMNLNEDYPGIPFGPDFRCEEGSLDALRKVRLKRDDLPREFYVDETHGGRHFYVVYSEEEIAYIHWIFKKGDYSRFFKIKSATTAELNYNITLPRFRGNKLEAKTLNFICNDLRGKGIQTLVGAISAENYNALKGLEKTGFKEFKRVNVYFSFVKKTVV